jgi:hypothetical protein
VRATGGGRERKKGMAQVAAASRSRGTLGSYWFFFLFSSWVYPKGPACIISYTAQFLCSLTHKECGGLGLPPCSRNLLWLDFYALWALFHHSLFIFFFVRADGQGSHQDRGALLIFRVNKHVLHKAPV